MADENRASKRLLFDFRSDLFEDPLQHVVFIDRRPQQVKRIYAGNLERGRIKPGSRKELNVVGDGSREFDVAIRIEVQ